MRRYKIEDTRAMREERKDVRYRIVENALSFPLSF